MEFDIFLHVINYGCNPLEKETVHFKFWNICHRYKIIKNNHIKSFKSNLYLAIFRHPYKNRVNRY